MSYYKQVLGDRQKVLGSDHPDILATSACLAATYLAVGRMPAAEWIANIQYDLP